MNEAACNEEGIAISSKRCHREEKQTAVGVYLEM